MAGLDRDGHPHRAEGPGQQVKVIIAGTRSLVDAALVEDAMSKFQQDGYTPTEIVSGGASGVDKLGEEWARRYHIPVRVFAADWNRYGRSAGPRRNETMALYADALVAIWQGDSPGTRNMIANMRVLKKIVSVWKV